MAKIRKQTKLWTTKSGERIRICDMTDQHLENTIKMLEKQAEKLCDYYIREGYGALYCVSGEMATYSIESDIADLEQNGLDPGEINPLYDNLMDEKLRREEAKDDNKL